MKKTKIEEKIIDSFNKDRMEIFDKIMDNCPKMTEKIERISIWQTIKNIFFSKKILYSFGSLSLLLIVSFIIISQGNNTNPEVFSTIAIDVNPSVEMDLDNNNKVIEIKANNADATIILGDMDLINVDYDVALNALIGSMLVNGYIDDYNNSVLISVVSEDVAKKNELMVNTTSVVDNLLISNLIFGSVLTRGVSHEDSEVEELADLLQISESKADFILEILELDPRLNAMDLALLSINDLNLFLESKNYDMDNIVKTGDASTLNILTIEEALNIVLIDLEIEASSVIEYEIEIEQENGALTYEIELETATDEYTLILDAKNGDILDKETSEDDETDIEDDILEDFDDLLSKQVALNLVLKEFEIDESDIFNIEIEANISNGITYYEMDFETTAIKYSIEVSAVNGEVFSGGTVEKEIDDIDDDDNDDDED